ncbi:hypothetical protein ACFLRI_01655, partial [Bacteroidota bacterium]
MSKLRVRKSKFLRILMLTLLILISTQVLFSLVMLGTSFGKREMASLIAQIVENRIESRVEIESANFSFSTLKLQNIQIFDHKDTILLEVPKMELNFKNFMKTSGRSTFKKLSIYNAFINAKRHKPD